MTYSVNQRTFDHLTGVNQYVKAMTGEADFVVGNVYPISLGTPNVNDNDSIDTDIDADAVAGTETTQSYTADSPFGRTLTMNMNGDPGNGNVIDVYGKDYLGQPMIERFTHVNGSTEVIYGKKAFYKVDKTVIVTAASNAVTADLGVGFRLGLPYKALDLAWAKENGVIVPVHKHSIMLRGSLADVDITSGASLVFRAPCPGYVKTLYGLPSGGGSTTNAATTVEIETVAVTGLTVTMDQDAQTIVSDTPTTAGYNANNRFDVGDRIEIVHAVTTGGGACAFELEIVPTQFLVPDTTDPATNVTGDPRGTYEALATLDDAIEIVVGCAFDAEVNANGNGGLMGIQQYFA